MNKQLLSDFRKTMLFLKKKTVSYVVSTTLDNVIVSFCYNIVLSLIMQRVLDAIAYGDAGLFKEAVLMAVVSLGAAFLFEPVCDKIQNYCVRAVMAEIKKDIFEKLIHMKVRTYEEMEQGDVLVKATKDVEKIERIYLSHIPILEFALLHGITAGIMMLYYNPVLGIIALVLGILQTLINLKTGKKISLYSEKRQKNHAEILQKVVELLDGYVDIKMSHNTKYFAQNFEKENQHFVRTDNKVQNYKNLLAGMDNLFENISCIGILAIGLWLAANGKTSVGAVAAVIGLQGNASFLFNNLSEFVAGLAEALPSVRRVLGLMEEKTEEQGEAEKEGKEEIQQADTENVIELKNLSFGYEEDTPVLKNINREIKKGQFVLIKGESGCGKSTLSKLLLGLYPVQKGEYRLYGMDTANMKYDAITEKIAYLDQACHLFPMSVAENIQLGKPGAQMEEIIAAAKLAGAHEFIQKLPEGYDTILHDNSDNVSGGQRQRIALARMFISNKPIFLIDEGTASLDEETEKMIMKSIEQWKGEKTIIAVTHRDLGIPYAIDWNLS